MLLPAAAQQLQLTEGKEILALRTVRPDITHLEGREVHFEISPISKPTIKYPIDRAFTAT